MTQVLIALLALIGVVVGAAVTWLLGKRANSGRVATAPAETIFAEGQDFRRVLIERVNALQAALTGTQEALASATVQITRLLSELEENNHALAQSRMESVRATGEISKLRLAIAAVHDEVKTGNSQTIAQLADNDESRRINEIPHADRTKTEREHLDTLGIQEGSRES